MLIDQTRDCVVETSPSLVQENELHDRFCNELRLSERFCLPCPKFYLSGETVPPRVALPSETFPSHRIFQRVSLKPRKGLVEGKVQHRAIIVIFSVTIEHMSLFALCQRSRSIKRSRS